MFPYYWWLLLSKWELNWYKLQHCSPQILHFQGLLSLWQPLCKKYNVWSGNVILQCVHCNPLNRGSGLVKDSDLPRECRLEVELLLLLLILLQLLDNFLRRSSLNNDFRGETFIDESTGRILDDVPLSFK